MNQTNEHHNPNADAKLLLGEAKFVNSKRKMKSTTPKIHIAPLVNQAKFILSGWVYSNLEGKITFVDDYNKIPKNRTLDVKQVGVQY